MQKALIVIGILILLVGLFWPVAKELPIGRLPGDISVKGDKYSFYFLIVSCLVISIVATLFYKFFNKVLKKQLSISFDSNSLSPLFLVMLSQRA